MAVSTDLENVAGWVRDARQIVVLTGAGISTESGIPDFRGPQGVWTKDPDAEKTATLQYYVSDPEIRKKAWQNRLRSEMWQAEPNSGHRALADLERKAALHTLVTQNVDGLHQAAGTSPERVVEIHGNVHEVKCLSCSFRGPMPETLERVRAGEDDPRCLGCGGILKSATISFGENLVPADLDRAQRAAQDSDVFLAIGSSLTVYPAAGLPEVALNAGARLVVMNAQETPFDRVAAAVFTEQLGDVLPALVETGVAGREAGRARRPVPLHVLVLLPVVSAGEEWFRRNRLRGFRPGRAAARLAVVTLQAEERRPGDARLLVDERQQEGLSDRFRSGGGVDVLQGLRHFGRVDLVHRLQPQTHRGDGVGARAGDGRWVRRSFPCPSPDPRRTLPAGPSSRPSPAAGSRRRRRRARTGS